MGEFAAIVLAAGVSNRKGQFAPLLPLGEQTIIETIQAACFHSAPGSKAIRNIKKVSRRGRCPPTGNPPHRKTYVL